MFTEKVVCQGDVSTNISVKTTMSHRNLVVFPLDCAYIRVSYMMVPRALAKT